MPAMASHVLPAAMWALVGGATAVLLPILTAAAGLLAARDNSISAMTSDGGIIQLAPRAIERVVRRDVQKNVEEVLNECRQKRITRADILAFEFEMGLFPNRSNVRRLDHETARRLPLAAQDLSAFASSGGPARPRPRAVRRHR